MPIEIGKSLSCFQSNGIISNLVNKLINRVIRIKRFQPDNKYSDLLESLIFIFSHISNYKKIVLVCVWVYISHPPTTKKPTYKKAKKLIHNPLKKRLVFEPLLLGKGTHLM